MEEPLESVNADLGVGLRITEYRQVMDGNNARFDTMRKEIVRSVDQRRAKCPLNPQSLNPPNAAPADCATPSLQELARLLDDGLAPVVLKARDVVLQRKAIAQLPRITADTAKLRLQRIDAKSNSHASGFEHPLQGCFNRNYGQWSDRLLKLGRRPY
jgi:hypothetical protein